MSVVCDATTLMCCHCNANHKLHSSHKRFFPEIRTLLPIIAFWRGYEQVDFTYFSAPWLLVLGQPYQCAKTIYEAILKSISKSIKWVLSKQNS